MQLRYSTPGVMPLSCGVETEEGQAAVADLARTWGRSVWLVKADEPGTPPYVSPRRLLVTADRVIAGWNSSLVFERDWTVTGGRTEPEVVLMLAPGRWCEVLLLSAPPGDVRDGRDACRPAFDNPHGSRFEGIGTEPADAEAAVRAAPVEVPPGMLTLRREGDALGLGFCLTSLASGPGLTGVSVVLGAQMAEGLRRWLGPREVLLGEAAPPGAATLPAVFDARLQGVEHRPNEIAPHVRIVLRPLDAAAAPTGFVARLSPEDADKLRRWLSPPVSGSDPSAQGKDARPVRASYPDSMGGDFAFNNATIRWLEGALEHSRACAAAAASPRALGRGAECSVQAVTRIPASPVGGPARFEVWLRTWHLGREGDPCTITLSPEQAENLRTWLAPL